MARVNILKGQVSDETFDATFDRINNTIEQIKAENFQPIINSGEKCMFFGRKCEYYSYCRDNSTYGLVSLKEV